MGSRINAEIYTATFASGTLHICAYDSGECRLAFTWTNVQLADILSYISEYLGSDADMDLRIHTRFVTTNGEPYRVLRAIVHSHLWDSYFLDGDATLD